MSNTGKRDQKEDYQALYAELEIRYDPGLAQEIVDQIKMTGNDNVKPDYMIVKAVSGVLEAFKGDIASTIEKLKQVKAKPLPPGIADMEEKRLEKNLQNYWVYYRLLYKGFNRLYERTV